MLLKKSVYLNNNKYYAKVETTEWDSLDNALFLKYTEPTVEVGGEFTDDIITYSLTETNELVKTGSPMIQTFEVGEDSYEVAGSKARIFVNTIEERIETIIDTFRQNDIDTNVEFSDLKTI